MHAPVRRHRGEFLSRAGSRSAEALRADAAWVGRAGAAWVGRAEGLVGPALGRSRPRRRWVRSPCDEKAKKGLHSTQLFPLFKAPALILNSGGRFRDIPPDRIAKIVQNI